MQSMTGVERVTNAITRKPVDRVPVAISPWGETIERWIKEGHITSTADAHDQFGMDISKHSPLKSVADINFVNVVLEETEDTILKLDGNGAKLRIQKINSATPEHVGFTVTDRAGWEELIRPHLLSVDKNRLNIADYIATRETAAKHNRYFACSGVAPFEQMHPVCGHEYLLMGMALDPDWVRDMVDVYAKFTIMHLETLFAEVGKPDGLFFFEDMGFKDHPFMSPAMYKEIVQPGHKLLFDWAHSQGLKVIVHSCGFVESLVPGLVEAGMDCLQAMEVKAGMDMRRLVKTFGDKIAYYGNIDVRALIANDREWIDRELEAKIPAVLSEGGGGYILHSDHSEPPEIDFETMKYFIERGKEVAANSSSS